MKKILILFMITFLFTVPVFAESVVGNFNPADFLDPAVAIVPFLLYGVGMIVKGLRKVPDEYIPVILVMAGILFCLAIYTRSQSLPEVWVTAIMQGIVSALVAVGANQVYKQNRKNQEKKEE
jgi:peptidoglycan/LPS O-acetylase OafA/YrhL